eukprot:14563528-Alexandrium_andersonii.AAC.1
MAETSPPETDYTFLGVPGTCDVFNQPHGEATLRRQEEAQDRRGLGLRQHLSRSIGRWLRARATSTRGNAALS